MIAGIGIEAFAVGVLAVLIIGISKGGFGAGAGVVSTPLFAMMVGPVEAAAIMLPVLLLMDAIGVWAYWRSWHWPSLRRVMGWGLVGVGLGWALFRFIDAGTLKLFIGLMTLSFFTYYIFRARLPEAGGRMGRRSWIWGSLAGFTSFSVHAGGPPLGVHLLSLSLTKTQFQAATVIFFAFVNLVKVPPYLQLGLFTPERLQVSAVLALLAPVGMAAGIWAHHRVPEAWFFRIILALLFVAGVKLTRDGLAAF
ncbi:sulfite exporter TauE/SafE family protein [Rhodovulum sp. YNF3179]|uniref:sulfite exporter TauE/SafE family protein n=1 Tax=Rhodovulum sp. YNF3179 TaxID=3425127 RepID=UPI003D329AF7